MAFRRRRGAHRRSARAKIDATVPWDEPERPAAPETTGPFDVADTPDDGAERVDLGALRVPIVKGVDLRVEVNAEGKVAAATFSQGGSQMQVGAFAAPRTGGLWKELSKELVASISSQGGTAEMASGTFGTEVRGQITVQGGRQPARFVGVDGPRWFLRALITGKAATEQGEAETQPGQGGSAVFEDVLRRIVVVRGDDPMPVRDPLPLRLPPNLAEQAERQQAERQAAKNAGQPGQSGGTTA